MLAAISSDRPIEPGAFSHNEERLRTIQVAASLAEMAAASLDALAEAMGRLSVRYHLAWDHGHVVEFERDTCEDDLQLITPNHGVAVACMRSLSIAVSASARFSRGPFSTLASKAAAEARQQLDALDVSVAAPWDLPSPATLAEWAAAWETWAARARTVNEAHVA